MAKTLIQFRAEKGLYLKDVAETIDISEEELSKIETELKALVVYNDPDISKCVLASAEKVVGKDKIVPMREKMSSEDFSQYLTKKRGVFFRLGTRNEALGCTTLPHNNDFLIDENALPVGSDTCVQFVLDNMNGLNQK